MDVPDWVSQGLVAVFLLLSAIYLFAYLMSTSWAQPRAKVTVKPRRKVIHVQDKGKFCPYGEHYVPRSTRMITPMDGREMCHPCYLLSKRPVSSFIPKGAA